MLQRVKDKLLRAPSVEDGSDIVNLPNLITALRITVVPFLFLLLLEPGRTLSLVIAILFVVAAVTDLLDGYLARKYQLVTQVGKIIDPIADKLIVSTAMILMIPLGRVPAWVAVIVIMRDIVIDAVRHVSSAGGVVISASRLGKQKTLSQVIAITALLIHYPFLGVDAHQVGLWTLYLSLVLTLWSGLDYMIHFISWFLKNRKHIKTL